jgi:ribosomal protein S19
MTRSKWKGPFIDKFFYKKNLKYKMCFLQYFNKIRNKFNINLFNSKNLLKKIQCVVIQPIFNYQKTKNKIDITRNSLLNVFILMYFVRNHIKCLFLLNKFILIEKKLIFDKTLIFLRKYVLKKILFLKKNELINFKNILKLKFKYSKQILIKKKFLKYKHKKLWSKRSVITKNFIGKKIFVYNGKLFKPIIITREMVGFKYGAFILTRKPRNALKYKKH